MRTNRRESRRMVLEQLEDRRLLYADYIACNGDGTLTITGTSSADDIAVSMNGSYEVTINTNTVPCDDRAGVALASDVKAISVAGGNGNDEIDLSAISGTALSFFSHITGGDVTISGGSGNDSLIGTERANIINGDDNDDTLVGGAGNDSLSGGEGNDTYKYSGSADLGVDSINESSDPYNWSWYTDTLDFSGLNDDEGVAVDLSDASETPQTVNSHVALNLTSATGLERVIGTAYDDVIVGNTRSNTLEGGDGADYYILKYLPNSGGYAKYDNVIENGDETGDTLDFSELNTSPYGITIDLGSTSQQYIVSYPVQYLLTLSSSTGIENVLGTAYGDSITGNSRNNVIYGGDGSDYILGGDGADSIYGEAGNDNLWGEDGDDYISAGDGNDQAHGGNDDDVLWSGNGSASGNPNDSLYGDSGDDLVDGTSG